MGEILDSAKGKPKQVAGAVTGKDRIVREGERDERKGKPKGMARGVDGMRGTAKAVKAPVT